MGSRFRIVGWMALAYFAIAMLTRVVLGFSLPPDAVVGVSDLPAIVGIGALYDACFIAYASILPVLFIAACPETLWQRAADASSFTARVSPRCMHSVSSLRPSISSGASSSRASTSSPSTTSSTGGKSPTTLLSLIRSRRSWPVCWLPRLPSTGVVCAHRFGVAPSTADGSALARRGGAAVVTGRGVSRIGRELRDRVPDNYMRELASDGAY